MPTIRSLKPLAVLLAAAALLALPAAAQATLAFVRNPLHPAVFVAGDDGSGAHKLASGTSPRVSPDGNLVVYFHEGPGHKQEMKASTPSGAGTRTLMVGWQETFYTAFSPDSRTIAALRGPELGKRKLVLVDAATGAQRVIAQGYFSGVSFSPQGDEIVYSRAKSERFPPRSDVFRVPVGGGRPVRLTKDHISQDPLWGPSGQIVFVKMIEAKKRKYGPKSELYLMSPQGEQVKRLTHTKVDPLLIGLFPTDWSADGSRLLAEFEGQDTSYAVAVNPRTGAQRPVVKAEERCPGRSLCRSEIGAGFVGTALSGDGQTVLGYSGGFEPGPGHEVVAVPYPGVPGKPVVLAKNAFLPDWSR
jgi:dipeptidyl aminopeptidase/acylaminoacyl peptidase